MSRRHLDRMISEITNLETDEQIALAHAALRKAGQTPDEREQALLKRIAKLEQNNADLQRQNKTTAEISGTLDQPHPNVSDVDLTVAKVNNMLEKRAFRERIEVLQELEKTVIPAFHAITRAEQAVGQLIARIDENVQQRKPLGPNVFQWRLGQLASELAACSREHKNVAIKCDLNENYNARSIRGTDYARRCSARRIYALA